MATKTMDYTDIAAYTGIPNDQLRVMKQRGTLPTPLHQRVPLWEAKAIHKWWAERLEQQEAAK